jgi:hypothetical protein
MNRSRMKEEKWFDCDGCGYALSGSIMTLDTAFHDYDENNTSVFHFHRPSKEHDCFRHWAHNLYVMKRSLQQRKWHEEEIDEFLLCMLYRETIK